MSELNEENYTQETFEPVETDVTIPQETVEPAEQEPVETVPQDVQEPVEPEESVPQDNWEVRARFQQSEAAKFKNLVEQQNQQIQEILRSQQPKQEEDSPPQRPDTDDPIELQEYTMKLNEYLLKQFQSDRESRQQREQATKAQQEDLERRQGSLGLLTTVTKNPEKSQKILEFFADTGNLQDPAIYNVMYDAAMAYKTGVISKPKINPKAPPPPTDGGGAIKENLSPDDAFNQQLGQANQFRL